MNISYEDYKNEILTIGVQDYLRVKKAVEDFIKKSQLKWESEDIRIDFFKAQVQLLNHIITSIKANFIYFFIDFEGSYEENEQNMENFREFLLNQEITIDKYLTFLNQSMIVQSWSYFEFALNTICNFIIGSENLKNTKIEKFANFLNGIDDLNSETKEKILKKFKNLTDPHISTNHKLYKLFKDKDYPEKNADFELLTNYGRIRNGTHNNFFYSGTEFEDFKIGFITFQFKNNKSIIKEGKLEQLPYLISELCRVVYRVFDNIDYPELIPNPTTLLYHDKFPKDSEKI